MSKPEDWTFKANQKNKIDGLELLSEIDDQYVDTVFFDPQYRGLLDKLNYGNEGARESARFDLPQMTEEQIAQFIKEIRRVLKPQGHLFLWVDKYHLCTGIHKWIRGLDLKIVDMIVWDKGRIGMGYRSRSKSEYILVLQRMPVRAKGCWRLHDIPDVWTEKIEKKHYHYKPVGLQKKLILCTTDEGGVVLDPAAGGYSVLEACREAGNRVFIGGDING